MISISTSRLWAAFSENLCLNVYQPVSLMHSGSLVGSSGNGTVPVDIRLSVDAQPVCRCFRLPRADDEPKSRRCWVAGCVVVDGRRVVEARALHSGFEDPS